jgi:hypothetical protein
MTLSLLDIPTELLEIIISSISSHTKHQLHPVTTHDLRPLLDLSLTCKRLKALAQAILHRSFTYHLKNKLPTTQLESFTRTILHRADLASKILRVDVHIYEHHRWAEIPEVCRENEN